MTQRSALIVAAALTAFILVVAGGLIGRLQQPAAAAQPQAQLQMQPQAQAEPQAQTQPQAQPAEVLPARVAEAIALAAAPGAALSQPPDLVDFQGTAAYEVQLDRGPVYVDASSGQVLYNGAASSFSGGWREHGEGEEHESGEHED